MRSFVLASLFLISTLPSYLPAQDASQMAMQAAQSASMQAAQQAATEAQRNLDQEIRNANAASALTSYAPAAAPKFSLKPGAYPSPQTVRLSDGSRGVVIYYTTDGWTPTPDSTRYTGPITLASTTQLQAIAVGNGVGRSRVSSAVYTFPPASPSAATAPGIMPAQPLGSGSVASALARGTSVSLLITAPLNSQTAQIGDIVPMALADDLFSGDRLVAPRGTSAVGRVLAVDKGSRAGLPGSITVQAQALTLPDRPVPLLAIVTREGHDATRAANLAFIVPLGGAFIKGGAAEIPAGARLTATVAAETSLLAGTGQPAR